MSQGPMAAAWKAKFGTSFERNLRVESARPGLILVLYLTVPRIASASMGFIRNSRSRSLAVPRMWGSLRRNLIGFGALLSAMQIGRAHV